MVLLHALDLETKRELAAVLAGDHVVGCDGPLAEKFAWCVEGFCRCISRKSEAVTVDTLDHAWQLYNPILPLAVFLTMGMVVSSICRLRSVLNSSLSTEKE